MSERTPIFDKRSELAKLMILAYVAGAVSGLFVAAVLVSLTP